MPASPRVGTSVDNVNGECSGCSKLFKRCSFYCLVAVQQVSRAESPVSSIDGKFAPLRPYFSLFVIPTHFPVHLRCELDSSRIGGRAGDDVLKKPLVFLGLVIAGHVLFSAN